MTYGAKFPGPVSTLAVYTACFERIESACNAYYRPIIFEVVVVNEWPQVSTYTAPDLVRDDAKGGQQLSGQRLHLVPGSRWGRIY